MFCWLHGLSFQMYLHPCPVFSCTLAAHIIILVWFLFLSQSQALAHYKGTKHAKKLKSLETPKSKLKGSSVTKETANQDIAKGIKTSQVPNDTDRKGLCFPALHTFQHSLTSFLLDEHWTLKPTFLASDICCTQLIITSGCWCTLYWLYQPCAGLIGNGQPLTHWLK